MVWANEDRMDRKHHIKMKNIVSRLLGTSELKEKKEILKNSELKRWCHSWRNEERLHFIPILHLTTEIFIPSY